MYRETILADWLSLSSFRFTDYFGLVVGKSIIFYIWLHSLDKPDRLQFYYYLSSLFISQVKLGYLFLKELRKPY